MDDELTNTQRQENRHEDQEDRKERRRALAQRMVEDAVENGVILAALALTLFTILGVLSFAIVQVNRANTESNDRLRHGIQCLLFEGVERRQYQDGNLRDIGEALGIELEESRLDVATLDLEHAIDVCQEFFTEEEAEAFFLVGTAEPPIAGNGG